MVAKKEGEKVHPKTDNLAGIMITVVSIGLLFLFLFGLFTPEYQLLAISIPVGLFTSIVLVCGAVLGWELSKRQS